MSQLTLFDVPQAEPAVPQAKAPASGPTWQTYRQWARELASEPVLAELDKDARQFARDRGLLAFWRQAYEYVTWLQEHNRTIRQQAIDGALTRSQRAG